MAAGFQFRQVSQSGLPVEILYFRFPNNFVRFGYILLR
jgi:hypothetical protein